MSELFLKISGLNSARTLLYITAPATRCVEILSAKVTDASNATNQQLECCWQQIGTLGTPTATPLTPSKKLHTTITGSSSVAAGS